tara:strand:+ start:179 stop:361 length:183 start_codon:yes stop_codon:yes gene_type:complete
MNEKNKILGEYKNKLNQLKIHSKLYFIDDNPKITDAEFDKLKISIINLEKKYPFLKKKDL